MLVLTLTITSLETVSQMTVLLLQTLWAAETVTLTLRMMRKIRRKLQRERRKLNKTTRKGLRKTERPFFNILVKNICFLLLIELL